MSERKNNILRRVLLLLILLTLLFIFVNSLIPAEISSEESETVSGFLGKIFPESTAIGKFISDNVRKIAHFVEFGVLGALLTTYAIVFVGDKRRGIAYALLISFFSAFIDETLQIFSGRGPDIRDVWLDFSGSLSASLVCTAAFFIIMKNTRNVEKGDTSGQNNLG